MKMRREMAQKDVSHNKEKASLLNRIEILTMENAELTQRQNQLMKLNDTLEMAVGSRDSTQKQ